MDIATRQAFLVLWGFRPAIETVIHIPQFGILLRYIWGTGDYFDVYMFCPVYASHTISIAFGPPEFRVTPHQLTSSTTYAFEAR